MTPAAVVLCLVGDVMTGRGMDQILPTPGDPRLWEGFVRDATTYVSLAEGVSGRFGRPVDVAWPWGDAPTDTGDRQNRNPGERVRRHSDRLMWLAWHVSTAATNVPPMADVVLRVRFTSGDHTDVRYEDPEATTEDEVLEHVVSMLASDPGVLSCHHGDRLLVIFARGVATIELAPRGAIL